MWGRIIIPSLFLITLVVSSLSALEELSPNATENVMALEQDPLTFHVTNLMLLAGSCAKLDASVWRAYRGLSNIAHIVPVRSMLLALAACPGPIGTTLRLMNIDYLCGHSRLPLGYLSRVKVLLITQGYYSRC